MIVLLLTSLLSIIYARLVFSDPDKAVYYFIPYNYLFDLLFFSTDVGIATISTVMRAVILLFFIAKVSKGKFFSYKKPSYAFFFIIALILLVSSVFGETDTKSLLETIKFILIFGTFYALLIYFSSHPLDLKQFKKTIFHES